MRPIERWSSHTCASSSSRRLAQRLATLAVALAWAGCAPFTLVEAKRTTIGGFYTVEPQRAWSARQEGKTEAWTVDGFPLESVRFVKALAEGEALAASRAAKAPAFKAHMTPNEIMEFVVDSLATAGAQRIEASNLHPSKFGALDGFGFDLAYLLGNGLESQGMVVGAVTQSKLHLILYTGARQHYFPKYKTDVDRIVESIRME